MQFATFNLFHARIKAISSQATLAYPGVVAALTAQDVLYNAYGLLDADQPVLCGDVVCFEGDAEPSAGAKTSRCSVCWGADKDGKIIAVEAEMLVDGGAYTSTSVDVTRVAAVFASGCYEIASIRSIATWSTPAMSHKEEEESQ
ncbi:MAG: hypothetical protein NVSMB44_17950 [Ktedonobacteraceae bacterium]